MPSPPAAPATAPVSDANELARLRNQYVGRSLARDRRWRARAFERRTFIGMAAVAVLLNLMWIFGLDRVMLSSFEENPDRGPIQVSIIEPDPVFEIPPEPVPAPSEFKQRQSAIVIAPPVAKMTPPPLNSADSNATQARIGAAGAGGLRLFNADGSIRLPEAGSANGTETAANPIEAGKARWAEMQVRGENPLDCQRSRFAAAYAPDESLGDKVSRKYLKWIGLADPAGIAERAAAQQARAADGCDPVRP